MDGSSGVLQRSPSASAWGQQGLSEQFWWDLRAETRDALSCALRLPRKVKDTARDVT